MIKLETETNLKQGKNEPLREVKSQIMENCDLSAYKSSDNT